MNPLTFFAPFSLLTRSSVGRLNAIVCTDLSKKRPSWGKVPMTGNFDHFSLSWLSRGENEVYYSDWTFGAAAWLHLIGNWQILGKLWIIIPLSYRTWLETTKYVNLLHFWKKRLVKGELFRLNRISNCDKWLKCSFLCCKGVLVNLDRKKRIAYLW